ncbi:MAG: hypothetical protein HC780_16935 [Leptolyngbyaceae cyanobacterium CSU_1_3]|nr:hypothetical protein [Leptolyngbyaceae cyanobacterium CSU_1_3]
MGQVSSLLQAECPCTDYSGLRYLNSHPKFDPTPAAQKYRDFGKSLS